MPIPGEHQAARYKKNAIMTTVNMRIFYRQVLSRLLVREHNKQAPSRTWKRGVHVHSSIARATYTRSLPHVHKIPRHHTASRAAAVRGRVRVFYTVDGEPPWPVTTTRSRRV